MKKLGCANPNHNELKKALTHLSFNEQNNSSRYVFLGMYAFKGRVADMLYGYLPGKGQLLQHILGNLFATSQLQVLFDKWQMEDVVRCKNLDISRYKHIFVYGLLGYIHCHHAKEEEQIILRHILSDAIISKYLQPKRSTKEQLVALCQQVFGERPKVRVTKEEDVWVGTVSLDGKIYVRHESKGKTYAQKKAIAKALKKIMSTQDANGRISQFLAEKAVMEQEEGRHLRADKHRAFLAANQEKKHRRADRRRIRKAENLIKDRERKAAKLRKKQRMVERKKQKEVSVFDTVMNAAKRRFLEDKLK